MREAAKNNPSKSTSSSNVYTVNELNVPVSSDTNPISILKDAQKLTQEKVSFPSNKQVEWNYIRLLSGVCKKKSKLPLPKASECRICGFTSYSFIAVKRRGLRSVLLAHMYSHLSLPIYSCGFCDSYDSNQRSKVRKHVCSRHGKVREICDALVMDNRSRLDKELTDLVRRCYAD